jgi:serine/threonine-protein kinase HipA
MVRFQDDSQYKGRSLLIERYDIPDRTQLEASGATLFLQEDACSLLSLRRDQKYDTSLERVAAALISAGVDVDGEQGMPQFLRLVVFSWIVGNGDLHAKNVSILHRLRTT